MAKRGSGASYRAIARRLGRAPSTICREVNGDQYREALFTLRDELFDYMWQNNLPFDLPAYCLMRDRLNQEIKRIHITRLPSWWRSIIFLRSGKLETDASDLIHKINGKSHREHFEGKKREIVEAFVEFLGLFGRAIKTMITLLITLESFLENLERIQQQVSVALANDQASTGNIKTRFAR